MVEHYWLHFLCIRRIHLCAFYIEKNVYLKNKYINTILKIHTIYEVLKKLVETVSQDVFVNLSLCTYFI